MSRTTLNFWLDAALMVIFVTLLWTATVIRFIFPAGSASTGWALWGYSYDRWCEIQFVLLCVMAAGVLVHVMLHWTWVCGVITSKLARRSKRRKRALTDGERTLYGVGLLVVLLNLMGLGLAAASLMIEGPS